MTEQSHQINLPTRSAFDPIQGKFFSAFTESAASTRAIAVLQEMDRDARQAGYDPFLEQLYTGKEVDEATGLISVRLAGTEAPEAPPLDGCVVMIGGFGMRLPEVVLLAEYWRRVNEACDRRVQVLAFGLPDAALDMGKHSGSLAKELLRLVDKRCGTPTSLEIVAYSAGNLPALELARLAITEGRRVPSMVAGAVPNPASDSSLRRSLAFFREAPRGAYPAGIPGLFATVRPPDPNALRLRALPGQLVRLQRTLTGYDTQAAFQSLLAHAPDTRLVFGFATNDLIGRAEPMQRLIESLTRSSRSDVWGVQIDDLSHAWGRCLPLLGEQAILATTGMIYPREG